VVAGWLRLSGPAGNREEAFMRLQPFRAAAFAAAVACAGLVAAGVPPAAAYAARVTQAPRVKLSLRAGPPTSTVRVSGSGFGAHRAVDIYFGTTDEALAATNGNGAFSGIRIRVPASAVPGRHYITAVQRHSGRAAQARFLVSTNWAQGRYSASRGGLNPYENVLSPSNVSGLGLDWWRVASGSPVDFFSAPAVVNGVAYLGYGNGRVHALNAATGAEKWTYKTGGIVESSPAVANGVVYAGSGDGNLYALNAATGAEEWSYHIGGVVSSSPAVANGVVYADSFNGTLYALNAATGAEEWSYASTGNSFTVSSPAVANGVVYVAFDRSVYALSAVTGAKEWSYTANGFIYTSPAVANGVVYLGSGSGTLYALNAATGAEEWSYTITGDSFDFSSPAVANGVVYADSFNGTLYALNTATGAQEWSYTTGYTVGSPAVANGVVYLGSDTAVYALNAATGAEEWSYTTGEPAFSSPAVANGVVYLGSTHVYAFGLPGEVRAVSRPAPRQLHPNYALRPRNSTSS
jgi:outer membrane protein assembly factor BamB